MRVSSKQDYKDQTTLNFDGEQVNFCSLGLPYTSSARPTGPYDPTLTYPTHPIPHTSRLRLFNGFTRFQRRGGTMIHRCATLTSLA